LEAVRGNRAATAQPRCAGCKKPDDLAVCAACPDRKDAPHPADRGCSTTEYTLMRDLSLNSQQIGPRYFSDPTSRG